MGRLRGMGLAICILAGLSGCSGLQHHLSWRANDVDETGETDSHRFGWWRRPAAERSIADDTGPSFAETAPTGPQTGDSRLSGDIWSDHESEGLARFFPNTVRRWNRLTSRFHSDSSEHADEVPPQPGSHTVAARTTPKDASRDRQVKTVRMDRPADDQSPSPAPASESSRPSVVANPNDVSQSADNLSQNDSGTAGARPASAPTSGFVAVEPTAAERPRPLANGELATDPETDTDEPEAPEPAHASSPASPTGAASNAPDGLLAFNRAPAASASSPAAAPTDTEVAPTLASVAGSAAQTPQPPASAEPPAPPSSVLPVSMVATTQVSESSPSPQSVAPAHNHGLLGWLCPLKGGKTQCPLPSSQLPALAYPASYESCKIASPAFSKHVHGSMQAETCSEGHACKKPCFLKTWLHTKGQATLESPIVSPQSELVAGAPAYKKPCFLKTWLHTKAQATLEAPLGSPQSECVAGSPTPMKPCFLKRWFHHETATTVLASPQGSPQSPVTETAVVKKPCFLKTFFHKFDHGASGCQCSGCLQGGSHCCCESQRGCGFKHHAAIPSGQWTVTPPASPAGQSASAEMPAKNSVAHASSSRPESNDVAQEG